MQKDWFGFSSAVKTSVSTLLTAGLAFSIFVSSPAKGEETSAPSPSANVIAIAELPEVALKVVQKNANGDQYQIGDRIPLFVELKPELTIGQTIFAVKPPEGGSKIEDQGWYVDPQTLLISNNLQFVVSPIQTGKLTLPTLLVLREDKTPIARTSAFTIQVLGPNEKNEPTELLDPVDVSLAAKYWFMFAAISLLVVVVSVILIRRYLKNRKVAKPAAALVVPKEPEHVIAMRALDKLYRDLPYSTERLKPVAFGISEILKDFFSARFHVDANESTTDEMIALLRKESLSSENLREIQTLFNDLDLIKFTKGQEAHQFNELHYQDFKTKAHSLIQKWAHRSEPAPSTGVPGR